MIKGKMQRFGFALDILISFALPFFLWRFMAPVSGDRMVILTLAAVGILYTITELVLYRQFNFIIAYFLGVTLVFDITSLMATNTHQLLLYSLVLNAVVLGVHGALLAAKRPIPYWVMVTGGMRLGHTKANAKWFFQQEPFAPMLVKLTLVVMAQHVVNIGLRLYYMVGGAGLGAGTGAGAGAADASAYAQMSQTSSMISIGFTIFITLSYMKIAQYAQSAKVIVTDDQPAA